MGVDISVMGVDRGAAFLMNSDGVAFPFSSDEPPCCQSGTCEKVIGRPNNARLSWSRV